MPIALPPRPTQAKPPHESFLFKSMLVASALFAASLLMVSVEFHFSAPGHSLSEAEVALHLSAR